MSHSEQLHNDTPRERGQGNFNPDTTFVSGEPGTHGREPFTDDSTFAGGATSGLTGGNHSHGLGSHHHGGAGVGIDDHHHNSGLGAAGAGVGSGLTGNHGSHHTGGGVGDGNRFGQTGATAIDEATASSGTAQHGKTQNPGTGLASAAHHATVGDHHKNDHSSGLGHHSTTSTSDRDNGRVGDLNQGGAAYERTGPGGPITGGAAGTDRFDSDRTHGSDRTHHSGAVGAAGSALSHGDRHDNDNDENSRRREGGGTGGVGGLLTTTDDEFIGRDRKGGESGAYGDEAGPFKGNKSGPGGNSALTGREGNFGQNAVAESRTRDDNNASASGGVHTTGVNEDRTPVTGATGTHGTHGVHDEHTGEKKGLMEKIKDALH